MVARMNQLIAKLQSDYPQFKWCTARQARWSAVEQTIYYNHDIIITLHELGHALLNHQGYVQDVELLQLERAAWDKASELAIKYGLEINEDIIEEALDSYRDWLHERSRCPNCGQTGWQERKDLNYTCPTCGTRWQVSSGKNKRLQRVVLQ